MGLDTKYFLETTIIEKEAVENVPDRSERLKQNRFNVLFLARVEKEKGVYEALEAYRLLKEKYPHVTMDFCR